MFLIFAPFTLLVLAMVVRGDPIPSAPGPGQTYSEGQTCSTSWTPDPTAASWKTMIIQLMTAIATLDGTSTQVSTFSFTCPAVTLNAAVYFYQYSTPAAFNDTYWTTRFTIADSSGNTVPAPNATQPDGAQIAWGVGGLLNAAASTSPGFPMSTETISATQAPASLARSSSFAAASTPLSSSSATLANTLAAGLGSSNGVASSSSSGLVVASSRASPSSAPQQASGALGVFKRDAYTLTLALLTLTLVAAL